VLRLVAVRAQARRGESVLAQLQQTTGLDLRRDVLAWMGDAGVFLAGTDRGALVVHSKDPAATRAFVRKLRPLVTRGGGATAGALDAPGVDEGFVLRHDNGGGRSGEVLVAAGGDKFVVATSRRALREALGGGATLGDAAAFTGAAGKLGGGMRPSLFVDIERATRLAAAAKGSDEHFAHVRPYLDAFGVVVAGTKPDGDVTRGRAIATLK